MKKYLLVLISVVLLVPCVWAQNFKRTSKMPGFFVPKGALQTESRPEKLVPVEAMRYQGKQAPIVVEMQRQAQEKSLQKAEEKAKEEAIKKHYEEHEKEKQKELVELQQEPEGMKKIENADNSMYVEAAKEKESVAASLESKSMSAQQAARLKAEQIKENMAKQQEQKEDDAMFEQIIAEYKRDVTLISEGKSPGNKRLIDMIADFKDAEHAI